METRRQNWPETWPDLFRIGREFSRLATTRLPPGASSATPLLIGPITLKILHEVSLDRIDRSPSQYLVHFASKWRRDGKTDQKRGQTSFASNDNFPDGLQFAFLQDNKRDGSSKLQKILAAFIVHRNQKTSAPRFASLLTEDQQKIPENSGRYTP